MTFFKAFVWTLEMLASLFLCLLLPIILGAEMWFQGLDKVLLLSYNTTPAEEEKALEMGDHFPTLKGLWPQGLTTRFWLFLTTYFDFAAFGLTTSCFVLLLFSLRLLPLAWCVDRFLGDHIFIFGVRVLTTSLTIVRCGLRGDSSTREHENARFSWQNSTKKH